MSTAPHDLQPILMDAGADPDIAADEVRTYWRAGDTECSVELTDDSLVISVRADSEDAVTVRTDVQARIDAGESTVVLASHLDLLGLRQAVEAWVRGAE
jgi:hypothetical protein